MFLIFDAQVFSVTPTKFVGNNLTKTNHQIDSSDITVISPSKEKETKLFSDSKLKYQKNIAAQEGMLQRFLAWLAEKLFGNAGYDNVLTARKIIIWTISIGAMIFLIWLLSKSEMVSLIKPKPKATSFNFIDVVEDLNKINFEQKIKAALKEEDYRMATRWTYLKILFLLDKNKLIEFASYKTNIDYKYELKNKKHQADFVRLSYIYEFIWYGKFVVSSKDYSERENEFINFEKELGV
ncbi:hypothetical protein [Sediminibacterium sp.]|uniref:hypothetical protein n=1 Tax=Sediminibacterium sp. TaxID=1917865 RepID=UPI002733799C|nr:hypothetical protein [Sediminibacterium sp.]MDP3567278.1 hypothetical protein [Sediminibacterium sp.]